MKKDKEIKEVSSMPLQSAKYAVIPSTLLLTKQNREVIESILEIIEEVTGVAPELYMASKSRNTTHVTLRQITAYCLKEYTNITLKDIGIIQGYRDHSTIIHSLKAVESWMDGAPGYTYEKRLVDLITQTYGEKCQVAI
ncbi:MAG: hypothetical protein EBR34_16150 [Sphingomonadaceae bacterium]|nr:hypothetical protein [Sphingomonadaceae bacterium]